jgi:glycine/D-amino acid oxidase-like deaminating enzyme
MGTRMVQRSRASLGDYAPDERVVADIQQGFHDRFPSLRDVALRRAWGGFIAMTPSWLPVAGDATPNVSYAVGYNGHGLAQAPYLGTLMADYLAGDSLDENLEVLWRPRPRFVASPVFTAPALRIGWALDRASDRLNQWRKSSA